MTKDSTQPSKHTPGPWSATMGSNSFGPNGRFSICRDADDAERTLVCEMPHSATTGRSVETREANARLIAAAPETHRKSLAMLEALKRLANDGDWECQLSTVSGLAITCYCWQEIAKEAIVEPLPLVQSR